MNPQETGMTPQEQGVPKNTLETMRDELRQALPAGIIPQIPAGEWMPSVSKLDAMAQAGLIRQKPASAERVTLVEGERPVYDMGSEEDVKAMLETQPPIQLWNRVQGENGEIVAFDWAAPENEGGREFIKASLQEKKAVGIWPFAGERNTIARNGEYGLSVLKDPSRVVLVDAGYDPQATENAKNTGATLLDQKKLWGETVDWERLSSEYALPFSAEKQPKGKSVTMMPAYWYLTANELIQPETIVFHADTDLIDPDPHIRYPEMPEHLHGGYDTLVNLGVPFVFEDEQNPVDHVVGGKQYRGNEGEKHEGDRAKQSRNHLIRQFGYMQAHFVQPVSDARAARLGNGVDKFGVGDGPWCLSMGIESLMNLNAIGQSIEQGILKVGQTAFAGPKVENAESPLWREAVITEHDTDTIHWVLEHVKNVQGDELAQRMTEMYDSFPDSVKAALEATHNIAAFYPQIGYSMLGEMIPRVDAELEGNVKEAFRQAVTQSDILALPHRWTASRIREFNQKYGGIGFHHNLPGLSEAGPNKDAILYGEFLIPGPNMMMREGLVDLDKVKAMYPANK